MAPFFHSSTRTEYGVGTRTNYGHVKLIDTINDPLDASHGTAATPVAVGLAMAEAQNRADKTLSNVTLTKSFSAKGYYKAPDGMMFAWGTHSQQTTAVSVYYYPVGFLYTPYVVLTTPTNFGDSAVEVAAAIPTATTYFTMRPRYIKRLSNGQAEYGNSGCTFQYLAIGRWK